jgi:F420-0:gamma-glutamyl ligase-like protein
MSQDIQANPEKKLEIEFDNSRWLRLPIRTHVITADDDILDVVKKYTPQDLKADDLLFISERIVAISQGRAWHIDDIKPSKLAKFLVKFVTKSPYGIGLKSPWTMELAVKEAGVSRIIFAGILSAITKPFGIRGVFYKAVGKNINAIDGPCDYTIPPYNKYAKLGPLKPNKVAKQIKEIIKRPIVIIDANDLGVAILGKSDNNITDEFCKSAFADNPLGQSDQQTPMAIVRPIK